MENWIWVHKTLFLMLPALVLLGCWGGPVATLFAEPTPSFEVELCSPPCWYGIIPGKTSAEEALSILKAIPGVREVRSSISGGFEWTTGRPKTWWYTPRTHTRNSLRARKGVVIDMFIELSLTETLPLGKVVERYGPPEGYETYYVRGFHADEADKWSVLLFYPQMGMTVSVDAPAERYGDVTADLEVTYLTYYVPKTMEELEKEWEDFYHSLGATPPPPCMKEWQGFHRGEKPCPAP